MNALFVNACVREGSRKKVLCDAYTRKYWSGPNVAVRERKVCGEPLVPLDAAGLLRRDRDIASGTLSGEDYRLAREFAGADEILIGAPYWDCSFPALLKIYLERICVNGIAFRYGEDGRPVKLCAAKKLVYITTAGGVSAGGELAGALFEGALRPSLRPGAPVYQGGGAGYLGERPGQAPAGGHGGHITYTYIHIKSFFKKECRK